MKITSEYEQEHNKFLEEKAEDERNKHRQILDKAKSELQNFYKEREGKIASSKEENRLLLSITKF